jgi:predicted RNase H-like nuclease (RuvC/YqgF family)
MATDFEEDTSYIEKIKELSDEINEIKNLSKNNKKIERHIEKMENLLKSLKLKLINFDNFYDMYGKM